MTNYIEKIKTMATSLDVISGFKEDVTNVAEVLLNDDRFPVWSGSSQEKQHHYGKGGLIRHTSEVIDLCFMVRGYYKDHYIDLVELFFSALFHDSGKMFDYEPVNYMPAYPEGCSIYGAKPKYENWGSTSHKRMIHHISRSGIIWSKACDKGSVEFYNKYHDSILHAILAHHTAREHGSPVAPKSRVAWILTLCDNLSARVDDADTWDVLGYRNNGHK